MGQPTPYSRLKNFVAYALAHPSAMFNASDHDAELDAIETTLDGLCTNAALIQRDDGALKNASVHPDSLTTATLALIASDWTPRGAWLTATAYALGDVVQNSTTSYVCATAHTSGVFATDYAAGKWIILGETMGSAASAISYSAGGNIVATNVQTAIEELDAEKAPLAGGAGQTFLVADAVANVAHAVSMQQVQKSSLISATGGGTGDAITATIVSGLTALTDHMLVLVEAPGSNTVSAPTFNLTLGSTATGALTIVKGNNSPLLAGDIGQNKMLLCYDASLNAWVLLNPGYPFGVTTAGTEPDTVENIGLAFSVATNALTIAVTTASGATPTASDRVRASMRASSVAGGTYNVRSITSGISLVISSGSTLGHANATASKIHFYLIDNAGTLELAASTAYYGRSGIVSTTAEGGAGGADSATAMYSTTARSSVPYVWIGETTDTQTTAGTWVSTPSAARVDYDAGALPPGAKFWAYVTAGTATPTLSASHNVTSITDDSTGNLTVTIGTDFLSANWVPFAGCRDASGEGASVGWGAPAAGSIQFRAVDGGTTAADPESWAVGGFGD